jgi:hypothetical protein
MRSGRDTSKLRMSTTLTERQEREIEALCRIAKENGAAVTVRELIGLAAIDASEQDLAAAFHLNSNLNSRFVLESGYVLERPALSEEPSRHAAEEERRRERALANLKKARRFGEAIAGGTVLVAVSGGNSFLSARDDEDIDLFCVTKTNGMWSFMLRALILARIHRLANRDVPSLCFSCVMDEGWARKVFGKRQTAIFARDALTAKILAGTEEYRALLEEASWMGEYFPAFYRMRLREISSGEPPAIREAPAGKEGSVVLNSFLQIALGSFLRMKSWALNRKFSGAGRLSSIFTTRMGLGHYIYESKRYRRLGTIYGDLWKDEQARG